VNNLSNVVMQLLPRVDLNPRLVDRKSNALPIAPPRHPDSADMGRGFGEKVRNGKIKRMIEGRAKQGKTRRRIKMESGERDSGILAR